jgi:uncharacterized protein with PQ loop repeat
MTAFMERPALKQAMGDFYPVVSETLRNMESQMERLVQSAAPNANLADVRQRVRNWAETHPIQDSLASRQSADPDVIKKVGQTNLGAMGSIKELAETMGGLSARLDSYNLYLPKQARWQAELFLEDLKRDPEVNAALSHIGTLANAAANVNNERLSLQESLCSKSACKILDAVQQQRIAILAALHAERVGAITDLHAERLDTMANLHAERLGATADLRMERQSVLNALRDQEMAVMNDIRATSEQDIQTLSARGHNLIDDLFLRDYRTNAAYGSRVLCSDLDSAAAVFQEATRARRNGTDIRPRCVSACAPTGFVQGVQSGVMDRLNRALIAVLFLSLVTLYGCQGNLAPQDIRSLLFPGFRRSEIFGFVAGFGTTFAALPDLVAMLRRRSSLGMNVRMAAILGVFQILWVYYGLLILSRPVIAWNTIAVFTNFLSVCAYLHFSRKERSRAHM